jgi:cobalt-zinc-cadmium efflux system membrane fusion protein
MTITDLREMHLELEVFEYDVALVRPGQSVSFYFQDRPDQVYKAEVHLVNKAVDAQTRTLVVHADIDQALQGSLTPGMFVAAQIAID